MSPRAARGLAAILYCGVLLLLTLYPGDTGSGGAAEPAEISWCLFCEVRHSADAVLNLLLFVPLGMLLAPDLGRVRAGVAGLALSLLIEVVQTAIPGRHPSLSDLVFNASGALLGGGAVVPILLGLVRDPGRWAPAGRAWVAACIAFLLAWVAAVVPTTPEEALYGQWTPRLESVESYEGEVLYASIGSVSVPSRLLPNAEEVRALVRAEAPIGVRFVVGPPPDGFAPVFSLVDATERAVVTLGVDGEDLVFVRRYRADDLLLDRPEHRVRGAMAGYLPGDTMTVGVTLESAGGYRLAVGGESHGVGHTPGRSWSLFYALGVPVPFRSLVDLLWLAAAALPVGLLFGPARRTALWTALFVGTVFALPLVSPLVAAPVWEYLAIFLGVGTGVGLRRALPRTRSAAG